jgi:adenylosuccinate lyase
MSECRPQYENPLLTRYSSAEMSHIFSPDFKFRTWRKLWIALAESEADLGLPITEEQITELKAHADSINYADAEAREKITRHDVMSHVHAYGLQCPKAAGILHLGATSAFVGDNTDLIQMREGLSLLETRLLRTINRLADFCEKWRELPTLGYTHYQPAQPTTIGKRGSLWMQDLMMDLEDLRHRQDCIRFRGVKGTTGTQASFMSLFENNARKVEALDQAVTERMNFKSRYAVTGQTAPRKEEARILDWIASLGRSVHRITNDLRMLAHLKEIEEPFESGQIGSSAMAYKRNPMRCERASSLAKLMMALPNGTGMTAATQWFERSLDDSAQKRIAVPEAFLAADAVLLILENVMGGLIVYPEVVRRHLDAELPFMATETILMEAVRRGGDRQRVHEVIRQQSMKAAKRVKEEGLDNDLLERLAEDTQIPFSITDLLGMCNPRKFVGRAPQQVMEYLDRDVRPVLAAAGKRLLGEAADLKV